MKAGIADGAGGKVLAWRAVRVEGTGPATGGTEALPHCWSVLHDRDGGDVVVGEVGEGDREEGSDDWPATVNAVVASVLCSSRRPPGPYYGLRRDQGDLQQTRGKGI